MGALSPFHWTARIAHLLLSTAGPQLYWAPQQKTQAYSPPKRLWRVEGGGCCCCSKKDCGMTGVRTSCSQMAEGLAPQWGPAQIRQGATWGHWDPQPLPTRYPLPHPTSRGGIGLAPGCGHELGTGYHDVPRMASVLGWRKYLQPSPPGGRGAMCHMEPSPGCQTPPPVPSNPISSPHSPGLGPGSWASCTPSQSQLPARTLQWCPHRGAGCMVAGTHSKDSGSPPGRGSAPPKVLPRDQLRAPAPQLWDQLKGLYGGGARAG